MKKIFILIFLTCLWVSNVIGQITISGTNTYDGTFTTGNFAGTYQGFTYNIAPSAFDAGTTYYHGNNQSGTNQFGSPYASTVFVVRQSNKWVIQYRLSGIGGGTTTEYYHTETTFSENNPPCNAWWIRNSDNVKVALQISGTTCDNTTCTPATAPTLTKIGTECVTASIQLQASGCSGTYRWNDGTTGTSITVTAPSTASTKTYYLFCDDGTACPSLPATSTLNFSLPAPTNVQPASGTTTCQGTSVTLTGSCASGTIKWYTTAGTTSNIVTPNSNTTYFAYCEAGSPSNCTSNFTSTFIAVNSVPTPQYVTASQTICTSSINIEGACSNTFPKWYIGNTLQTASNIQNNYGYWATLSVSPTTATTYTIKCENGSCTKSTDVIITPGGSSAPSISPVQNNICFGTSATLTATGCNGTVNWYNYTNAGYTQIGTGTTIVITPAAKNLNYNYAAKCISGTCTSAYSNWASLFAVDQSPAPAIAKNPTGNVTSGTNVTLTASGCTDYNNGVPTTIKWENNSTTNPRTVVVSANGTYSAKCVWGTCESPSASTTINLITPPPNISPYYDTYICIGQSITLTATGCASPDVVTWSTGATGTSISVTPATFPATYSATCTRLGVVSVSSNILSVYSNGSTFPSPPTNVTVSPTGTVAAGTTLTLTGTCPTAGSYISWYAKVGTSASFYLGNASTITHKPDLSIVYAPYCQATYCSSNSVSLAVNVTPQTPVLSVNPAYSSTVCGNSTVYLSLANCNNGTLQWTVNPVTSPVPSGSGSFTNISIGEITQTTTYTATCTESGLSSNSITVNYVPNDLSVITASPTSVTSVGQSVALSATCSGTINWYANGATTMFATGSSVTHTPTTNTTYTAKCVNGACDFTKVLKVDFSLTVPSGIGNTIAEGQYLEDCGVWSATIYTGGGPTFNVTGTACVSNDIGTYIYNKSVSAYSSGYYAPIITWNGYFIRRTNNIWEIISASGGQSYGTPTTVTTTRLFHTSNIYNSSRPPCTASWVKDADNSTQTINLTGVCENATAIPCPANLSLDSPPLGSDDYSSGALLKQASNGIVATNKITGTSTNISYKAGSNIQLNAGFKADNGTVFKAEIGGCQ